MKKEIFNLLSWIHDPSRTVGVVFSVTRDKKEREDLKNLCFKRIRCETVEGDESWQGILSQNNTSFLTKEGRVILLNNKDFFYKDAREYVDGPSPKDLKFFKKFKVFGIVSQHDELKIFAPQCKYRWQIWLFKWVLSSCLKKIDAHDEQWLLSWCKESLALANFLWQNNINHITMTQKAS